MWHRACTHGANKLSAFLDKASSFRGETDHEAGDIVHKYNWRAAIKFVNLMLSMSIEHLYHWLHNLINCVALSDSLGKITGCWFATIPVRCPKDFVSGFKPAQNTYRECAPMQ